MLIKKVLENSEWLEKASPPLDFSEEGCKFEPIYMDECIQSFCDIWPYELKVSERNMEILLERYNRLYDGFGEYWDNKDLKWRILIAFMYNEQVGDYARLEMRFVHKDYPKADKSFDVPIKESEMTELYAMHCKKIEKNKGVQGE